MSIFSRFISLHRFGQAAGASAVCRRGGRLFVFVFVFVLAAAPWSSAQIEARLRPEVKIPERAPGPRLDGWRDGLDVERDHWDVERDRKLRQQRLEFELMEHPTSVNLDRYVSSWELEHPKPPRLLIDDLWTGSVRRAQGRLRELGYLQDAAAVDGIMGPKTRRAVKRFQAERGLRATGELDWVTMSELDTRSLFRNDPLLKSPSDDLVSWYRRFSREGAGARLAEPPQEVAELTFPDIAEGLAASGDPGVVQEEVRERTEKVDPIGPRPPPGTDPEKWKQELKVAGDQFHQTHVKLSSRAAGDLKEHPGRTNFEIPLLLDAPVDLTGAASSSPEAAHRQYHPSATALAGSVPWSIREAITPDSVRYQLHNSSGSAIGHPLAPRELATKLNALLDQSGNGAVSVELSAFSGTAADALASSLTIQLRQVNRPADRNDELRSFSPAVEHLVTTTGAARQSQVITIERLRSPGMPDSFRTRVPFGVVVANQVRRLTVSFVHGSLELIFAFLDRLGVFQPPNLFARKSLQQLVNQARDDLKRLHPGLTDRELQVMIVDQAGNTGIVELRLETTGACS
ncbi:peptidoglycan-binding protein [Acidobacteria bacterium AB60]|nr:peptidoglycan-binding protein [Acidobacteria bacterium AB60]